MTPFRDGLDRAQTMPVISVPLATRRTRALAAREMASAILHQRLPHAEYAGIRRWAPAFLDAFVFQGVPAEAALMRAIDVLREMNRRALSSLPKSAPIGFIRERWARHVLRGGSIDRRYYELCVLSELRPPARRRRLGGGQPAISCFRGTPDPPRDVQRAGTGRHLAD
jgi:hypothetical protein